MNEMSETKANMEMATRHLRWLVSPGTGTRGPKLQQLFQIFTSDLGAGKVEEEWRDVATVVAEVPFQ